MTKEHLEYDDKFDTSITPNYINEKNKKKRKKQY